MLRLSMVLLCTSLTCFSTFLAVRLPFLAWGPPPSLPGAQELWRWQGFSFGYHIMSCQLLLVWLVGALLGPRRGALSMALYLILGLAGLPVFINGGGWRYVFQPTFGYLLAFLPATIMVGIFANSERFGRSWLGMAGALALIDGGGLIYELLMRGQLDSPSTWWPTFYAQVLQFLPGQLTLLTLAALVASAYHWVASRAKDWLLPPPPLVLPTQEPTPQESA